MNLSFPDLSLDDNFTLTVVQLLTVTCCPRLSMLINAFSIVLSAPQSGENRSPQRRPLAGKSLMCLKNSDRLSTLACLFSRGCGGRFNPISIKSVMLISAMTQSVLITLVHFHHVGDRVAVNQVFVFLICYNSALTRQCRMTSRADDDCIWL